MIDLDQFVPGTMLTVDEVAYRLECSRATVFRRRAAWGLEFQRIGRTVYVPAAQVRAAIESGKLSGGA